MIEVSKSEKSYFWCQNCEEKEGVQIITFTQGFGDGSQATSFRLCPKCIAELIGKVSVQQEEPFKPKLKKYLKELYKKYNELGDKADFCNEHKFSVEAKLFDEKSQLLWKELNKLCKEFDIDKKEIIGDE